MENESEIAFVKLLTDHQSMIRAFVISLLPGAPDVDDVIQETNIVLWRKREQFELGTNFKAWALKTARFQVMSYHWTLKKRRLVTLDNDVADLMAREMEELLEPAMVEKRISALRDCIQKLRPQDRELLMERYWYKKGLRDFAVLHGRSLNGLKVQLFRLRAALRRCIQEKIENGFPS